MSEHLEQSPYPVLDRVLGIRCFPPTRLADDEPTRQAIIDAVRRGQLERDYDKDPHDYWHHAASLAIAALNRRPDPSAAPVDTAAIATAQAELLEDLLDAQDQETDLDGRPTGPPYYVIGGDGARWFIESALAKSRDSVSPEQPRVWSIPEQPGGVTAVADRNGDVWQWDPPGRVWRLGRWFLTWGQLLDEGYGPLTEVREAAGE